MGSLILIIASCLLLAIAAYLIGTAWRDIIKARDELEKIHKRLNLEKSIGWGALLLSVGNILDIQVPFPFPFVGPSALYFTGLSAIVGIVFLVRYYTLSKVPALLALAEKTNGYLTKVVIMRKLGLPENLVERTLRKMLKSHDLLILNPDKQYLADIIFLVRSFSGKIPVADEKVAPRTVSPEEQDAELRRQHGDVVDLGVDEINNMLLRGSLNLGGSGRPVRGGG